MIIETLTKYNKEDADRIRELLIQLSRSGKDRGEIPEEWFELPYDEFLDNVLSLAAARHYGFSVEMLKEKVLMSRFQL